MQTMLSCGIFQISKMRTNGLVCSEEELVQNPNTVLHKLYAAEGKVFMLASLAEQYSVSQLMHGWVGCLMPFSNADVSLKVLDAIL